MGRWEDSLMKNIIILCVCLFITSCSFSENNSFVCVSYEGYKMPNNSSVWIEDTSGDKLSILHDDKISWCGYFKQGDRYLLTKVVNNVFSDTLGTLTIKENDIRIVCNVSLSYCREN